MPFGLTNAPAAFQRRMNQILAPFIDEFVVVYLDDILIFSRSSTEHEHHIKRILKVLSEAGMILNIEKCKFFKSEVKFLGHIVSEDGIRPDPAKIQKILEWPTPRNITEVRSFTNFARFFSRYMDKFAKTTLPLTDLMQGSPKKGAAICWTEREEEAFNELKRQFTSPPCLIHYQLGETAYIDVDCSQRAIGGCLQQYVVDPDGKKRLHPIAFESKKLSPTEQRYSAQERELLAVKHCLNHWRHLIEGSQIVVRSDHESLKGFRTQKYPAKRLTRFINEIEHFNPIIAYQPGKLQIVPDALSRMPGLREEGEPADTDNFLTVEETTNNSEQGEEDDNLQKEKEPIVIKDLAYIKRIVEEVHTDLGHYGKAITATAIKNHYSVSPQLLNEALKVLDSCKPCQLYKPASYSPTTATLHPHDNRKPFEFWEIDFVGPLVKTKSNNEYLITAVDYATSTGIAYALPERSAEVGIELLEEIIWTYGLPKYVLTDNGAEFRSTKFQAALSRYEIQHKRTTPGHPQTNGKVERLNYELIQRLQKMTVGDRGNWDQYLRKALFAFHAHSNARLGCSPFFLQYGVEPVLPSSATIRQEAPLTNVELENARVTRKTYVQNLQKYRTDAAEKYLAGLERLASRRDEYIKKESILPGDLVMRSISQDTKLHPKWDGPFVVLKSTDKDVYQLATANGYVLRNLINVERIRKLSADECGKYAEEFWNASERLKAQDERARQEQQLLDVNKRLGEATIEHLDAQKAPRQENKAQATRDLTKTMSKIAEISSEKRTLEKALKSSPEQPRESSRVQDEGINTGKRLRKLPWKLRDA